MTARRVVHSQGTATRRWASGIEHVVAGPGRPGGPRRAARRHPRELVELQQPGDAVADRGRIPAGLGLDLRDDPQRRQLRALLRGEVGDQRQVAARGGGEAGGVHARRRRGDVAAGHRAERHTQHGDERTAQDLRNAHARLTRPARSAGPGHSAGGPAGRSAPLSAAAAQPSPPASGRAARPSRRSPDERPARHGPADERCRSPEPMRRVWSCSEPTGRMRRSPEPAVVGAPFARTRATAVRLVRRRVEAARGRHRLDQLPQRRGVRTQGPG